MSGQKIIRNNFLTRNGITYSFRMTNHIDPLLTMDTVLTRICDRINSGYQGPFPFWSRTSCLGEQDESLEPFRRGARVFPIWADPNDPQRLFECLDMESRMKIRNWLIFERNGETIQTTHFGPFGSKNEKFSEEYKITMRELAASRKTLEKLRFAQGDKLTESEKEKEIMAEIMQNFLSMFEIAKSELQSKVKELKDLIDTVYVTAEDREAAHGLRHMLGEAERLHFELAKMKAAAVAFKIAEKAGAKLEAKTGLKGGGKFAVETAAKKIPVIGLGVGIGLAALRLAQGDVAGAGLEVLSGAAACVPGAGTAVSGGIDVTLLGRDIYKATQLVKNLERIQEAIKALGEEYKRAKKDYDFVKQVMEDPEFSIENLQHNISILEDSSAALK